MANESAAPKGRTVKAWLRIVCGSIVGVTIGYLAAHRNHPEATAAVPSADLASSILFIVIGGFFLTVGVGGYFLVIVTNGLTFDFTRPVWDSAKKRLFLANFFVRIFATIGAGLCLAAVLRPVVVLLGLPGDATMLPLLPAFVVLPLALIWLMIWAPVERRIIFQRLIALGVSPEQMAGGLYIGLSNPDITASRKRIWCIEEDMGMLWFTPEQLVFWGDKECFGITRSQLVSLERKMDAKSSTALSGTAHVILHVRQPNGERQIRLHTEGIWTLGSKRRASDDLAARLNAWHTPVFAAAQ